jgi:hypothetical protein
MKRFVLALAGLASYAAVATSPVALYEATWHDAGALKYIPGSGIQQGAITFDGIAAGRVLVRTQTVCGIVSTITFQANGFGVNAYLTRPSWNERGYTFWEYTVLGLATQTTLAMNSNVLAPGVDCGLRVFVKAPQTATPPPPLAPPALAPPATPLAASPTRPGPTPAAAPAPVKP